MHVSDCFNQNLHSSPGELHCLLLEQSGREVIKLFFMLNSAEHETLNAHTHKISRNSAFFQDQPRNVIFPAHTC